MATKRSWKSRSDAAKRGWETRRRRAAGLEVEPKPKPKPKPRPKPKPKKPASKPKPKPSDVARRRSEAARRGWETRRLRAAAAEVIPVEAPFPSALPPPTAEWKQKARDALRALSKLIDDEDLPEEVRDAARRAHEVILPTPPEEAKAREEAAIVSSVDAEQAAVEEADHLPGAPSYEGGTLTQELGRLEAQLIETILERVVVMRPDAIVAVHVNPDGSVDGEVRVPVGEDDADSVITDAEEAIVAIPADLFVGGGIRFAVRSWEVLELDETSEMVYLGLNMKHTWAFRGEKAPLAFETMRDIAAYHDELGRMHPHDVVLRIGWTPDGKPPRHWRGDRG